MIDHDTRINPDWTVAQLLDLYDGHTYETKHDHPDRFICDFCAAGVAYSSSPCVAQYVTDRVLNPDHPVWQSKIREHPGKRPLTPLATYCEDCAARRLYFPCEGFNEARVFFTLEEDRTMSNPEVTDVSSADDGIPWNPRELSQKITGVPWEANAILAGDELWGAENMVTVFLSMGSGVDIRELVKWDGSLDPQVLGHARREYRAFTRKMLEKGQTRTAFRDHVRGDN